MTEKYSRDELVSFVEALRKAAVAIKEFNPSHHIVSLNGGLPLFDILGIVDIDVDSNRAVYFPGSSRIKDSKEVMRKCFENFFLERQYEGSEPSPLASLDEVVGGHSVERIFNAYEVASRKVAEHNLRGTERRRGDIDDVSYDLRQRFPLKVFGVRDMRESGRRMSQEYQKKLGSGNILEFPCDRIITMDDPDYETVKFAHPTSASFRNTGGCYYPRVSEIVRTEAYESLLRDIAGYIGVDPDGIELARSRVMSDCLKYSRKPEFQ